MLGEEKTIHVTETLLGGQWEKQAQSRGDRDSIRTPSSAQGTSRKEKRAEMVRPGRESLSVENFKEKRTYGLNLKSSDGTGNHAELGTATVWV